MYLYIHNIHIYLYTHIPLYIYTYTSIHYAVHYAHVQTGCDMTYICTHTHTTWQNKHEQTTLPLFSKRVNVHVHTDHYIYIIYIYIYIYIYVLISSSCINNKSFQHKQLLCKPTNTCSTTITIQKVHGFFCSLSKQAFTVEL